MNFEKLESVMKKLKLSRRELWDLTYEELDILLADAQDLLDEVELLALELEQGSEKVDEIIADIEFDDDEWDEEEE
ncbi:hypothetical protein KAU32_00890 [bacterium]|nr:hypothetical protein [bacterium]